MRHTGWLGWMMTLVVVAAWGCGDDDDDVASAPAGKELQALKPVELRGLCEQLLQRVRTASTPDQQCIEAALSTSSTSSACETAKKSCLSEKEYQQYDEARCKKFEDLDASDVPTFDCDTTVSEVTSCYERVAKWLEGLRCSQAGKAPEIPSCIDDLSDGRCKFGFPKLLDRPGQPDDGSSLSCEPKDRVSCLCGDGMKGTQTCNDDGVYEPCDCSSDGAECKSGSKTFAYDFGVGTACNECATNSCCASYVECQSDADCACYWDCLGQSGQDDCFEPCGITDSPKSFVDHAVCLRDNCRAACEL